MTNNPQDLEQKSPQTDILFAPKRGVLFFLLKKYLSFDKTQPFISITALLAFLGVGVGVMVLIVAMAIMNGMSQEFEKRLFVMNYPLNLFATSTRGVPKEVLLKLEKTFPELDFSPYVKSQAIAREKGEISAGVLFGVDFKREARVNAVLKNAISSLDLDQLNTKKFPLITGDFLAENFLLNVGDKITLFFTQLAPTGLVMSPLMKRFDLISTFNSGLRAYDLGYFYTNIHSALALRNENGGEEIFDGIHINSPTPMQDIKRIHQALGKIPHPPLAIEGWWQQNGNFFAAMALEKRALFIVLMLIILMASLNIISSLLMVIMNRRREIALLLSMGLSTKEIKKLFFCLGNVIGLGGVILGALLSAILLWVLDTFPVISLPEDVYGVNKLPLHILPLDLLFTFLGTILIIALSSYYPALKASKINPLKVLRNE